jgi:hypothetical protein
MSKFIKSLLEVTPFKEMPEMDNDQMFDHIEQVLSENKWLIVVAVILVIYIAS